MPLPTISALPTAPNRSMTNDDFIAAADAFVAALATLQSEMNAFSVAVAAVAASLGVSSADAELLALSTLVSAANKLPYFTGSGTAALADFTSAGRALLDDADAAAQRATLALGTIATQNANAVAITGGSVTGITDLTVADGGTGSSTASGARTNLSAAQSGTNSDITSLSALSTALSLAQGGTGATSAGAALAALGGLATPTISGGATSGKMAIGPLTLTWIDVSIAAGTGSSGYGNGHTYGSWARAWINGDDGSGDVSLTVTSPSTSSASIRNSSGGTASGVLFAIGA